MKKGILVMSVLIWGFTGVMRAQFVVMDPAHIVTSILNALNQIVETATTADNMINNFKEVQKIYNQGQEYYDQLRGVNDLVKDSKKVRDAIMIVGDINDIYVNNYQKMLSDPHFRQNELVAISKGYTVLLRESADMLMELKNVVNENGLSMTDAERMDIVNNVYENLRNHRNLVNYYTRKNISVSYLRAKKAGDTERVMSLYGNVGERYW